MFDAVPASPFKLLGPLTYLLVALVLLLASLSVAYPPLASASSPAGAEPPDSCVDASPEMTRSPSTAAVHAEATREGEVINVSYHPQPGFDGSLTVDPSSRIVVEDYGGFDGPLLVPTDSEGETVQIGDLEWDRAADTHWISYRYQPIEDKMRYPATEDWLVRPLPEHRGASVYVEPRGEGYVGSESIALGDVTTTSRTVGCQEITVVSVGEGSSMFRSTVENRLDDLAVAAAAIPVGQRPDRVHVFTVQADLDQPGFVPANSSDVLLSEEFDGALPVLWVHEYVHTLQHNALGENMEWTREATATYLSVKVAYETGLISPAVYDAYLSRGYRSGLGGEWSRPLAAASTEDVAYYRGANVFARLDTDLEESGTSIYEVFEWLFTHQKPSYEEFETYLGTEANLSAATVAGYEPLVFGETPLAERYHYSVSRRAPDQLFVGAVLLFHPYTRSVAKFLLAVFMSVQTVRMLRPLTGDLPSRAVFAVLERGSLR